MNDAAPRLDHILLLKHHRQPADHILKSAADLARRSSARLTFADALEGGNQVADLFQSARLQELEALLSPHLGGVEADYRLIDGGLEAATDERPDEFDLVFLADNPRTSEARGHEIRRLLRRSSAPIWLDSGAGHAPRRILAALDVETQDPLKRELNRPILERALLLASLYGAKLDILSVWTPPTFPLALAHRLAGKASRLMRHDRIVRQRVEHALEKALRLGPPLTHEPRVLVAEGLPAESIALTTDAYETDLLVAGHVGRDGLAAWLIGDTAEKLSRQLDCSIVAVKPTARRLAEAAAADRGRAA